MSLPAMPWNPLGTYDCTACYGESRRLETDCPECGGTGWAPPLRTPEYACDDCGRPLWLGGRGPQWFEHDLTGNVRCRFCLLQASRRRRGPGTSPPLYHEYNQGPATFAREDRIDLATFVDRGDGDSDFQKTVCEVIAESKDILKGLK